MSPHDTRCWHARALTPPPPARPHAGGPQDGTFVNLRSGVQERRFSGGNILDECVGTARPTARG
jgi:hypothetical protein